MNEMNEKIKFFFEKKITAHIVTSTGRFYNGLITQTSNSFLVINDRMLGETPITISEIELLETFNEDKHKRGKEVKDEM